MKIVTLIISVIAFLLTAAAVVCGLWIKVFNITEPSSITFHIIFGVGAVVFCFITCMLVVSLIKSNRKKQAPEA